MAGTSGVKKRLTDPGKPQKAKTLEDAKRIQAENEKRLKS
jgi:hypothetical protein